MRPSEADPELCWPPGTPRGGKSEPGLVQVPEALLAAASWQAWAELVTGQGRRGAC